MVYQIAVFDFLRKLSFYFTTVGYYFCTMALSGVGETLPDIEEILENTALNAQFLFQIGVFTVVPMNAVVNCDVVVLPMKWRFNFLWNFSVYLVEKIEVQWACDNFEGSSLLHYLCMGSSISRTKYAFVCPAWEKEKLHSPSMLLNVIDNSRTPERQGEVNLNCYWHMLRVHSIS